MCAGSYLSGVVAAKTLIFLKGFCEVYFTVKVLNYICIISSGLPIVMTTCISALADLTVALLEAELRKEVL